MRARLAAAVTAGMVALVGLAGVAWAVSETAADDFESGGYGGSTGSVGWEGDWSEFGDSGGADGGSVTVDPDSTCASGQCLSISTLMGGLAPMGAQRDLDLSAAHSASLSYHIDFPGGLLVSGRVVVEARGPDGWTTLHTHGPDTEGTFTADLSVGDTATIRFTARDLAVVPRVGIDDVEVAMDLPAPTTTTTTTTTPSSPTTTTTTSPPSTTTTTTAASTTTTESSTTTTTAAGRSTGSTTTTLEAASPTRQTTTTASTAPGGTAETGQSPRESSTTTSRVLGTETTTDTTGRSRGVAPTTTSTVRSIDPDEERERAESSVVVTGIDPGLGSNVGRIEAQDDLLVTFGLAVEDIALDILASAALGLVLAWASHRRLS